MQPAAQHDPVVLCRPVHVTLVLPNSASISEALQLVCEGIQALILASGPKF